MHTANKTVKILYRMVNHKGTCNDLPVRIQPSLRCAFVNEVVLYYETLLLYGNRHPDIVVKSTSRHGSVERFKNGDICSIELS